MTPTESPNAPIATTACTKVRLRFAKRGDLRLVSHHDLMRCLERMARRGSIPMAYSQGFNPRPRIVFTLALGLGIEGEREVLEMELAEPMEPEVLLAKLAAESPEGLEWLEAEPAHSRKSAQAATVCFALQVPDNRRAEASASLERLLASERWPYLRRRAERATEDDLRPFLLEGRIDGTSGLLSFRLKMTQDGSARPEDVIDALDLRDLIQTGAVLIRTDVELAPMPPSPAPAPPSSKTTISPAPTDRLDEEHESLDDGSESQELNAHCPL